MSGLVAARRINQARTSAPAALLFGTDLAHSMHEEPNRLGK
jgi:hypothetical protein